MGKADREHRERVEQGLEPPFRNLNPVERLAVKLVSQQGVVNELRKGATEEQIAKVGELSSAFSAVNTKLRKTLEEQAPKEMDKGIRKFQREGKKVTVEGLLEEVKSTPGFLKMCEGVGLTYQWFEELAKDRMLAFGLKIT